MSGFGGDSLLSGLFLMMFFWSQQLRFQSAPLDQPVNKESGQQPASDATEGLCPFRASVPPPALTSRRESGISDLFFKLLSLFLDAAEVKRLRESSQGGFFSVWSRLIQRLSVFSGQADWLTNPDERLISSTSR